MSALTRRRADPKTGLANDLHIEYYSQRASAAIIITECTHITADAITVPGGADIHRDD